jgi:formylglycine-generating enzyme required for sulfatase activity
MGAGDGKDHSPVHRVSLGSFLIGRCEVTNAQYLRFCHATGHRLPAFWGMDRFRSGPRYPDHPVVGVSWFDAGDFAAWNGMRLPTEAEWEYAARGGLAGRNYPNGDALEARDGNFAGSDKGGPVAVGSYPANGYGLHDIQGNVVEWVQDYYDAQYYALSPVMNPGGPESADARPEAVRFRVIRGGGWHSGKYCSRCTIGTHYLATGWISMWASAAREMCGLHATMAKRPCRPGHPHRPSNCRGRLATP